MSVLIIPQNSIFFNSHNQIKVICQPIFDLLDLTFFRYLQVYKDLSRIDLCTHPELINLFYSQELYKISWFDKASSLYQKDMEYIWDVKGLSEDTTVGDIAIEYDVCHGFSLIRVSKNFHEIFEFATHKTNVSINEVYVQHLEIFEKFILYFNEQARELIDDSTNHSKLIFVPNQSNNKPDTNTIAAEKIENFHTSTRIKRFYINATTVKHT